MNELELFRGAGRYYVLKGHEVVAVDAQVWAQRFEIAERRVAHYQGAGIEVSTVFLGLDHRHGGGGPPLVFETMVFGGPMDESQWRWATWDEAERGHGKALSLALKSSPMRFLLAHLGIRYSSRRAERWLRRIKQTFRHA